MLNFKKCLSLLIEPIELQLGFLSSAQLETVSSLRTGRPLICNNSIFITNLDKMVSHFSIRVFASIVLSDNVSERRTMLSLSLLHIKRLNCRGNAFCICKLFLSDEQLNSFSLLENLLFFG